MNLIQYTDKQTGLILASDGGRDNMPVCTALAHILTDDCVQADLLEERAEDFINRPDVKVEWGTFRRYPGANDNSVDNMIGLCYLSKNYAQWIWQYKWESLFSFNVSNYKKFSFKWWYGRFLGFPSYVKFVATGDIGILDYVLVSISMWFSTFGAKEDTSNKILQYIMNQKYAKNDNSRILNFFLKRWNKKMNKIYAYGPKQMFEIYFGASHPFTMAAKMNF